MKRPTAKKLHLSKETLRTLSNVDLRAVIGGTNELVLSDPAANCPDVEGTFSCADSADGCPIDVNPNVLIGLNTVRRF